MCIMSPIAFSMFNFGCIHQITHNQYDDLQEFPCCPWRSSLLVRRYCASMMNNADMTLQQFVINRRGREDYSQSLSCFGESRPDWDKRCGSLFLLSSRWSFNFRYIKPSIFWFLSTSSSKNNFTFKNIKSLQPPITSKLESFFKHHAVSKHRRDYRRIAHQHRCSASSKLVQFSTLQTCLGPLKASDWFWCPGTLTTTAEITSTLPTSPAEGSTATSRMAILRELEVHCLSLGMALAEVCPFCSHHKPLRCWPLFVGYRKADVRILVYGCSSPTGGCGSVSIGQCISFPGGTWVSSE